MALPISACIVFSVSAADCLHAHSACLVLYHPDSFGDLEIIVWS